MSLKPVNNTQIEAVLASFIDFGKLLGIDLADKLPQRDSIYLLNNTQYVNYIKSNKRSEPFDSHGFAINYLKKVVVNYSTRPSAFYQLKTLTHEVCHIIEFSEYFFKSDGNVCYKQQGFTKYNPNKFEYFSEAFTELTAWYVIKNFWKQNNTLAKFVPRDKSDIRIIYSNMLIIWDMLISYVAKKTGENYIQTLNQLQRYYISDPSGGIKFLQSIFGPYIYELENIKVKDIEDDDTFVTFVKKLPLQREFEEVNDGKGIYKFYNKL